VSTACSRATRIACAVVLALAPRLVQSDVAGTKPLGDLFPPRSAAADPAELAARIAALDGVSTDVFRALATSELRCSDGETQALTPETRGVLLESVERMGRLRALSPALAIFGQEGGTPDRGSAVATLQILGLVGGAEDLRLASEAFASFDGLEPDFERALLSILERDPGALERLASTFQHSEREARFVLVNAAGRSQAPGSRAWLAHRLRTDPDVDLAILSHLARPPRPGGPTSFLDEESCRRVLGFLGEDDHQLRRGAVRAAAHLGDFSAVPILIERLDDASEVIRLEAQKALIALTGLRLGATAPRWRAWLETEQAWYAGRAPALLENLQDQDSTVVVRALAELASHRLERNSLARAVVPLLEDGDELVRQHAALTLARLGSLSVLPDVALLLEHRDAGTVALAKGLLAELTGVEPDPGRHGLLQIGR